MAWVQNEQLGDSLRIDARVELAAVHLVRRNRFQNRHPLVVVRFVRHSTLEPRGVPDVHDPSWLFGALEGPARSEKLPPFVVRQRVVGDATELVARELHLGAEKMGGGGALPRGWGR